MQSRLRKRGRKGKWTYTHTIRKQVILLIIEIFLQIYNNILNIFSKVCGQIIEVKTPVSHRDYSNLIAQEDTNHFMINKTRRCFLYHNQYFQLDIYKEPCHERCAVRKIILMSFYFKFIIHNLYFFLFTSRV